MVVLDTNVLVYAHRESSRWHGVAAHLMKELALGLGEWAIPWPCVHEFLGVVTNPRIYKDLASTSEQAWEQLEAWLAAPQLRLLGETDGFPDILRGFIVRPGVVGPKVHDARIAAICVAHGADVLLTNDRDFSLFPELPTRNPFTA